VPEIPKLGTGKINYRELEAQMSGSKKGSDQAEVA
jgi:hypothetical protein